MDTVFKGFDVGNVFHYYNKTTKQNTEGKSKIEIGHTYFFNIKPYLYIIYYEAGEHNVFRTNDPK